HPPPHPYPPPKHQVYVARLSSHECRWSLRQHHHPGSEPDPLRDPREIAEHHKRVVKRVDLGIDARERPLSTGVNDAEHMVVGKQVVKAEALDGETNLPNSGRIAT